MRQSCLPSADLQNFTLCRVDMHAQDDDDGPAAKRASALVTAMQTLMDIECTLEMTETNMDV